MANHAVRFVTWYADARGSFGEVFRRNRGRWCGTIEARDRKDEVKITAAIGKLIEEDPALVFEQNAQTQEMVLAGQGEIHLKVAIETLQSKYGLALNTRPARV